MSFEPLATQDIAALLTRAAVPEHSVAFMQAMSGGRAFCVDDYLFLAAEDWLMAIGYPLLDAGDAADAALLPEPREYAVNSDASAAFESALDRALALTGARACWLAAPAVPPRLSANVENRDVFFMLPCDAPVPAALRRPVARASERLRVTEDRAFAAAHRRLWAEFLSRANMRSNVRELYARTEAVLAASRAAEDKAEGGRPLLDLRLLSAWDGERLCAALLLDYSPKAFCSYIIGAHSRENYSPHATDLLFASMLKSCAAEGKAYVHLGLGVNEGISRFKKKWGGREALPYVMASWTEKGRQDMGMAPAAPLRDKSEIGEAMRSFLQTPAGLSKQQIFDSFPKQRSFAMIYEVRKGEALSYLCGTAHFFCYSFEMSFRRIFEPLHTVIFEGPLDEAFLADVEKVGRNPEPGARMLIEGMTEDEIKSLERVVYGPEGTLPRLLGLQHKRIVDVRRLLSTTRPWFAFFSLWVAFLERQGWSQSVDLEAWGTAMDMGKVVIGMENLKEQVASLEAVPYARVIDFFRRCNEWPSYMKRNISAYLDGDLGRMMGSSIEFPSRTEMVIEYRDTRFFERMLPFMEAGDCAVFVGTAHLVGLRPMLEKAGFAVAPAYPSFALKMRAKMRGLLRGGA